MAVKVKVVQVYKTNLISTIVDRIRLSTNCVRVYKTNLISTIVDVVKETEVPEQSIRLT